MPDQTHTISTVDSGSITDLLEYLTPTTEVDYLRAIEEVILSDHMLPVKSEILQAMAWFRMAMHVYAVTETPVITALLDDHTLGVLLRASGTMSDMHILKLLRLIGRESEITDGLPHRPKDI